MDVNEAAERDELLARYGIKPTMTPQEALRAARKRGAWSAAFAIGSLLLVPVLGFMATLALMPIGGMADPDLQAAFRVALIVIQVIAVAVAMTGVFLGATTIVRARRLGGGPERTHVVALGVIGVLVGAVMCAYLIYNIGSLVSGLDL